LYLLKWDQILSIQKFIQRTSFGFMILILNPELLSNLPIKEKVPPLIAQTLIPAQSFLDIISFANCSVICSSRSSSRKQRMSFEWIFEYWDFDFTLVRQSFSMDTKIWVEWSDDYESVIAQFLDSSCFKAMHPEPNG